MEYDEILAKRATENLSIWSQAQVVHGDGVNYEFDKADVIVVNAGVTHPAENWLEALTIGGRLLLPLTAENRWGAFLKVIRLEDGYEAEFVSQTGIFHCVSNRDADAEKRLEKAFKKYAGKLPLVKSLYRTEPIHEDSCWYYGPNFWLSTELIKTV